MNENDGFNPCCNGIDVKRVFERDTIVTEVF